MAGIQGGIGMKNGSGTQSRSEPSGALLHRQSSGSGARDFLCLHGLVDSAAIWRKLVGPLGERGRVTCLDQRGHGESGAPPGPYRRDDLASDVVAVLDDIGSERAILVGHSMGGIVSMATALGHPERVAGLVLIGTASQCNEKTARWYERIAAAGDADGCAGLARAIYGRDAKREVRGDAQGIAHVTRMLTGLHDAPLTPKLGAIACPVLLLVGEKDPMGSRASERIAEALPPARATLEVVPGAGHWLHVECPDRVLAALDRWLAEQEDDR